MTDQQFRKLEFTATVAAPIEAAWDALTTGDGLAAWYVSSATVNPGVGGTVAISFGEGPEATSRIDVWEPPKRVRFAYVPQGGMEVGGLEGGSEEWLLTHDGGITTIRLVHSLPDPGVDDWEGYYGDIERGWTLFLATLTHYLEATARRGRITTLATPPVTIDAAEAWATLHAELGLRSRVEPGSATTVTIDGVEVGARVLVSVEPLALLIDVDGTLLLADIEGSGEHRVFYALASTFGDDTPETAARRETLVEAVERAAG